MESNTEFININQIIYTNIIMAIISFILSLLVIILYLKKKELKEMNYTIFACIAGSNAINCINQFFGIALINYELPTVNKKWYATTQRILNLFAEFSYAYYSLYYFYYIYEKITTYIEKTKEYLYHIIIGIFLFTLGFSIFFVITFNLNVNDNASIANFEGLVILNGLLSIDDVLDSGNYLILYYLIFFPPLILYFYILNKLRIKLSDTLKKEEAKKKNFLKKFYDFTKFLMFFGVLNLFIAIIKDSYDRLFYEEIIDRKSYYLRIEILFSFLANYLANARGFVYFFIFLMDDKVMKIMIEYIDRISIIDKIKNLIVD